MSKIWNILEFPYDEFVLISERQINLIKSKAPICWYLICGHPNMKAELNLKVFVKFKIQSHIFSLFVSLLHHGTRLNISLSDYEKKQLIQLAQMFDCPFIVKCLRKYYEYNAHYNDIID